jgi:hypothetical protein
MITKGFIPFSGANSFAIMEVPQKTRTVGAGRKRVIPGVLGTSMDVGRSSLVGCGADRLLTDAS